MGRKLFRNTCTTTVGVLTVSGRGEVERIDVQSFRIRSQQRSAGTCDNAICYNVVIRAKRTVRLNRTPFYEHVIITVLMGA